MNKKSSNQENLDKIKIQTIKKGYKQTEIGVIPEDWDCVTIDEIAKISTGDKDTQDKIDDGNYSFFVRSQIVEKINSYSFDGEAVLTSGAGVGVGKIFHYINGKFDYHQRVYNIHDFSNCYGQYFYYYFSNNFYDRVMQMTAKSSVDSVRREMISKMKIPLPPTIEEQKQIANTLSDTDQLIQNIKTLITKKKAIKQGAMQELLTGKKRLQGFDSDWNTTPLSELCSYINDGTHHTPIYVDKGIPFYSVESLTNNDFKNVKFISEDEHSRLIKRCKPELGDILLTRIGTLGITKLIDWNVNASIYVSLALLKVKRNKIDNKYLYSYTKSDEFVQDIIKRSLTNATPQKINMGEIGDVPIHFPQNIQEQQAIAQILNDMDTEIETLEQQLQKTQTLKQGMMQELLTGKTRLIVNDEL